jgi:hypothetical protein
VPTHDEFLADVVAVYIGDEAKGSFGSGRLIAPALVLTAGHVVDYPNREDPTRTGWKVALIGERNKDGRWTAPAHDALVIWRGLGDLDLALLQLSDKKRLEPKRKPEFASYDLVGPISEIIAVGFPEAWGGEKEPARDYSVYGTLRIASQLGPYAWTVLGADKPDKPEGWKGMSGSSACRFGANGKLYLFGIVQEVPANFSEGQLEVARISDAFENAEFRSHLQAALGCSPVIAAFTPPQREADLGVARIFEARTRAFTEEYLVSEKGPVPFGGRDGQLRRLDAWLLDPATPPRMVVTAPAGRGKSALLVRWMKNLQDGGVCGCDGWNLAFMPISIRTGTNRPEVFYEGIARRLTEITGEALPTEAFRDSDGFRYAVRDQLDRLAADGKKRALIVIDGLDEALEGSFDVSVLPKNMPKNVRVLLSARWQLGDRDSQGWLERLAWDRGVKVEAFELDRLDAAGVGDVLVKLGAPVDLLARDRELVEKLDDLTMGEPLLVRFYAEDLWSSSVKGARVTRADLEHLKPGFDSYFERWFKNQDKAWKEEETDPEEVDKVLMLLAFAKGPLQQADLVVLVKRIHEKKGIFAADRLIAPLRRWVFGGGSDSSGYVLSHPKISEYLQEHRFAANKGELLQGFAEWGKAHLKDLNSGLIAPQEASAYLLQNLPWHLKSAKASPEDFMMMVEDGWRRAWERFEGGQRGFANAVQTAFVALREDEADPRIGARWRCALTLSSIKSLGQNVPPELLLAAVERRALTIRQAAYFADLMGPSKGSVRLLAGLAAAAKGDAKLREELLIPAFAAAKAIGDKGSRAQALAALAPHLPPEQRQQALNEALAGAEDIHPQKYRARALAALAPQLPPDLLGEALAAAKAIGDPRERAVALAALAPRLPPVQIQEALGVLAPRQALSAVKAINYEDARADALASLAPYLPPALLPEALAAAKAMGDEDNRAQALAALAPHLPPEQRQQALNEALAAAKAIRPEKYRARALAALAPQLPPELLPETLAAAKAIEDAEARGEALSALAPQLPLELLGGALAAAKAIGEDERRAAALAALAPQLSPELLSDALASAKAIRYEDHRAEALAALAPRLPADLLNAALAAAKKIGDEEQRAKTLKALAPQLPPVQRQRALQAALAAAKFIRDERNRAQALEALIPQLPPELLGDALAAANAIGGVGWDREDVLAALAPKLPPELLGDALAAANAIGSAKALGALIPQLPPELLGDALAAANAIGEEYARVQALEARFPQLELLRDARAAEKDDERRAAALAALAPQLPPELLGDALAAVNAIGNEWHRAVALAALAPKLPPELLGDALAAADAIGYEGSREHALAALAPKLPPVRRQEALSDALAAAKAINHNFPFSRVIALADVMPQLLPEQRQGAFSDALAAAKAIGDHTERAVALELLIPQLPPELLGEALAAEKNDDRRAEGWRRSPRSCRRNCWATPSPPPTPSARNMLAHRR